VSYPAGPGDASVVSEVSILGIAAMALKHVRTLVWFALAGLILGGLVAIVRPRYVAQSTFLPETSSTSLAGLVGLAAQFGVNVPGAADQESLDFYGKLLESRELLEAAVLAEYRFSTGKPGRPTSDSLHGTLMDVYDINDDNPHKRLLKTIDKLDDNTSVHTDMKAGTITVKVIARYPELAVLLNRRLLDLVNDFNLRRRQSQAGAERRFVEARMQAAQQELTQAEDDMARFLERNRRYQDSPQLTFEASRLQRKVDFRQQLWTTLGQAYEQARITEVRNTPVITILDAPEGSEQRSGRVIFSVVLGVLVGGLFGVMTAAVAESLERQKHTYPQDYALLRDLVLKAARKTGLARLLNRPSRAA